MTGVTGGRGDVGKGEVGVGSLLPLAIFLGTN
jgi:hypothetical protein